MNKKTNFEYYYKENFQKKIKNIAIIKDINFICIFLK